MVTRLIEIYIVTKTLIFEHFDINSEAAITLTISRSPE